MTMGPKADLHRYLQDGRDAMLWKLDGLGEYGTRRPLTPTGTNLLGLVKHLAAMEMGYFGDTFGRPFGEPAPGFEDGAEHNADMWANPEETRDGIADLYRRACAHSDVTIESLPLDTLGQVPHWPEERRTTSLHRILVHMIAETHRHAGHADIVRELIDGSAGRKASDPSLFPADEAYRERLEQVARDAGVRDESSR